ncbi:hypothetical protein [Mycobacteroides abscessus]|uniref:hypothetical protein n=1 Tax=Mycobacteroides abscessus TaxID=36809 RepID=UPI001896791C
MGFNNIAEVKKANKALGHHWFDPDPSREHRVETEVLGGFYWVESMKQFNESDPRVFKGVACAPNGEITYLNGAEEFATKELAVQYINGIIENR